MELSQKIKYCAICQKSKHDIQRGLVCGLTNEKPTFDEQCDQIDAPADAIAAIKNVPEWKPGNQIGIYMIIAAIIIVVVASGYALLTHKKNNEAEAAVELAQQRANAVTAAVEAKKATLPQTIDGIIFDSISLHKKYVGFTLRLPNTYIQNYPDDRLICESKFRHSEALKNLRNESPELLKACINDSLQIRYAFREATDFPIYTIVVHPKDMEQTLNSKEPFRCPQKDFERVLKSDTKSLPFDIVSSIQLSGIKMDYGANKLTLNLRSRRKEISKRAAFENLAKTELWKSAFDLYSVKMLILNGGSVDFRFIGTNDRLIESVIVGPDFYQQNK